MSDIDVEGWMVEEEHEHHVLLTSLEGEIAFNHVEDEDYGQVWYADAELDGEELLSWKIQVQDREELVESSIPNIINEEMPKHRKNG